MACELAWVDTLIKSPSRPQPTLRIGILGSVLCFVALPPLNWHWLAWIAPVPWLTLIQSMRLPDARAYRKLWVAGMVFWLLAVHWIRLPHPLNYLAWFALAAYLGLYLPVFVLLSRTGVHRWKIPLVIVAPVVWTGLDWIRAHFLTGFLMASLAHTQYRVPLVIQLADITGEYGVTFLIMLTASSVVALLIDLSNDRQSRSTGHAVLRDLTPAVVLLILASLYGVNARQGMSLRQGPRIALIQGNTPADWKMDQERQHDIMREYIQLSRDAVRKARERDGRPVELVVWPETAFRQTLVTARAGFTPSPERVHASVLTAAQADLAEFVRQLECAAIVGIDRVEIVPSDNDDIKYEAYNSAVFVNKAGDITATYDKMHRVPFGEFIPLAQWFPFLYDLTPLTGGIAAGSSSAVMELADGTYLSPNICYETVVPHLIRWQWKDFVFKNGMPPDALVNITNDAWFWGSSELEMHLACGVFRAVETRTPLLIAANGGLSAHIDAHGNIRQLAPRRQTAILVVDLDKGGTAGSLYLDFGDWFAGLCVVCSVILAIAAAQRPMRHSGTLTP